MTADRRGAPPVASLEGVLDRISFANEENAWSVVKIAVPGRRDLVTAVGNLLGVAPGENLRLSGQFVLDPKYGEQFRVDSYVTVSPATLTGLKKYLGSGLVEGIGKVMAERLVDRFGMSTLDIIERAPERLAEVEGIGPVRSDKIQRAWVAQRQIKNVMIFLQSHGVSTLYAIKIYKRYGDRAITLVKENPYRLAVDIFGIGFQSADQIARRLGIASDSPERAAAGVLFVLGELSSEGHVGFPRPELSARAAEMLEVDIALVERAIDQLAQRGEIVVEPRIEQPGLAVYLKALYGSETGSAVLLGRLMAAPAPPIAIDVERAIAWFQEQAKLGLAPEQRDAIRQAISSKALVITGGPGTGKTTLVNGIIRILEKKGLRVVLAAPTGRAAKRMAEATGREAKTIHRLLEFSPKGMAFQRNEQSPLDADLLVLDEASMIDTMLLWHVLRAIPPSCRLIVVGDVDQLPSVGPGSVLADLLRSAALPVVRLSQIFRQAVQSLIVVNAHRVNVGKPPIVDPDRADPDFFMVDRNEPEEVLAAIKHLIRDRIPAKFHLDPIDDIQVLTPMHRGILGAGNLNVELQALLNPDGAQVTRGSRTYRVGDKVMQIRNNYDLDVYNGDIGRIAAVDDVDTTVTVRFDGREVTYETAHLDELVAAYACSIHKSQGSEYPCVVLPFHTQHYVMLKRNLLYTAITRGRRLVVIVGNRRAVDTAVRNNEVNARFTQLSARLRVATGLL